MIYCPVCEQERDTKEDGTCVHCDSNLAPLLRLRELPQDYYSEGIRLKEAGYLEESIGQFLTALNLNPDDPDALFALAELYTQKGSYASAAAQYRKVLEISPDNDKAIKGLEQLETINYQNKIKERTKQRVSLIKYGISFIAGIFILFVFQRIPIKLPVQIFHSQTSIPKEKTSITTDERYEKKVIYIVKKGDSLSKIAQEKYGSQILWGNIYDSNRGKLQDPNKLIVGDTLLLPDILILPKK